MNADNYYNTLMERQTDAEMEAVAVEQVEAFRKRLEALGWVCDYMNEYDVRYTKKGWRVDFDSVWGMPEFKRLV